MKLHVLRVFIVFWLALLQVANAADIVRDVKVGREPMAKEGGYLELGAGLSYLQLARDTPASNDSDVEQDGFGLTVAGGFAYNYHAFFIEASQGSFDGLNVGLNLYQGERWSFDLLAASLFGRLTDEYNEDDTNILSLSEPERNEYLLQRDTLYSGAGLRATYYVDDYVVQFRVVDDVYDDAGVTSTLRIGRSWLHKNWNIHAIVSAEYSSGTTNSYLYGVSEDEATQRFQAYRAGSSVSFSGELGFTYPVSKHWVYRSFIRYRQLPGEISHSPLVSTDHEAVVLSALLYVF